MGLVAGLAYVPIVWILQGQIHIHSPQFHDDGSSGLYMVLWIGTLLALALPGLVCLLSRTTRVFGVAYLILFIVVGGPAALFALSLEGGWGAD